ncbi:MAG: DegT/DnrJ/EryC1/StrS family aminotransferase [archaeon]
METGERGNNYFNFSESEWRKLQGLLESGALSAGSRTSCYFFWRNRLEKEFAKKWGARFAVSFNSETSSIHAALAALGAGNNSQIITSPLTCYSTVTPMFQLGCIPVFCDVEEETLALDPEKLEKLINPKTSAVIATYLYGLPVNIKKIKKICRQHQIPLIEDCAHVPGLEMGKKPAGSFGDIGCFSFAQEKMLSCGEGGMAVTSNKKMAEKMTWFRESGRKAFRKYEPYGLNYRMTEVTAFLALRVLNRLPARIKRQRKIAGIYFQKKLPSFITAQNQDPKCLPSVCLFKTSHNAPQLAQRLIRKGVDAKDIYAPLNQCNVFQNRQLLNQALWRDPVKVKVFKRQNQPTPVAQMAADQYFYLEISPLQSMRQHERQAAAFETNINKSGFTSRI